MRGLTRRATALAAAAVRLGDGTQQDRSDCHRVATLAALVGELGVMASARAGLHDLGTSRRARRNEIGGVLDAVAREVDEWRAALHRPGWEGQR